MKTLIVAFLILSAAQAQDPPSAPQPGERLQRIAAELKLSQDQIERIRPILAEEAEKLRQIRDSGDNRRKQLRDAQKVRDAANQRLKPILTEDQFKQLKKMQEDNRERLRRRKMN